MLRVYSCWRFYRLGAALANASRGFWAKVENADRGRWSRGFNQNLDWLHRFNQNLVLKPDR